jgi:hypothetical protein
MNAAAGKTCSAPPLAGPYLSKAHCLGFTLPTCGHFAMWTTTMCHLKIVELFLNSNSVKTC